MSSFAQCTLALTLIGLALATVDRAGESSPGPVANIAGDAAFFVVVVGMWVLPLWALYAMAARPTGRPVNPRAALLLLALAAGILGALIAIGLSVEAPDVALRKAVR